MSGKSSQRKGADGERELAELLRGHGYDIRRGGSLSFGEVPDLMGLPGIHIEVKRVERLNVGEAMVNTPSGMVPSGRSNGAHRTGKWCRLTAWMVHGHTASV